MKILLNNASLFKSLRRFNDVGFVPTMGGIHKGHLSLINKSSKLCKKTIVSIFVNPKQFNNKKDLKSYPRNINIDLKILKKCKKVDFVYIPKFKDIFTDTKKSKITLLKKQKILCAKFRRGHFEGVLDVMDRLTRIVNPKKIFMGEKDFQQLYLVKKLLEKKYKTKVISCKTIRDKNNVALSSRNFLLNKSQLKVAASIYKNVSKIKSNMKNRKNITTFLEHKKNKLKNSYKIKIDYLELRNRKNLELSKTTNNSKLFIAYYLKNVRLIDNL